MDPEDEAQAALVVRFDEVQAEREPAAGEDAGPPEILFVGQGLIAQLHAAEVDPTTTSTATAADELAAEVVLKFVMTIPSMQVDDLAVYNRLFSETWDAALLGGTDTLSGAVEVTEEALSLHFDLASDEADLRLGGYHATTDLLLQLRAAVTGVGAAAVSAKLDLAETTLQLTDAQLDDVGDVDGPPPAWSAAFRVDQAGLVVPLSANRAAAGTMRGVLETLSNEGFGALLQAAEGEASAVLTAPRSDWLAQLIERPKGLQLGGGGELDVHAVLSDGLPIAGSSLRIPRQALAVSVLEHQVEGAGEASLMLEAGDKGPQARLTVAFDDARLHRLDEDEPSVGDVRLDTEVLVRDPFAEAMKDAAATAALSLAIRSARVPDMRTYNPYLPEHAGVAILGGEVTLFLLCQPSPAEASLVVVQVAL